MNEEPEFNNFEEAKENLTWNDEVIERLGIKVVDSPWKGFTQTMCLQRFNSWNEFGERCITVHPESIDVNKYLNGLQESITKVANKLELLVNTVSGFSIYLLERSKLFTRIEALITTHPNEFAKVLRHHNYLHESIHWAQDESGFSIFDRIIEDIDKVSSEGEEEYDPELAKVAASKEFSKVRFINFQLKALHEVEALIEGGRRRSWMSDTDAELMSGILLRFNSYLTYIDDDELIANGEKIASRDEFIRLIQSFKTQDGVGIDQFEKSNHLYSPIISWIFLLDHTLNCDHIDEGNIQSYIQNIRSKMMNFYDKPLEFIAFISDEGYLESLRKQIEAERENMRVAFQSVTKADESRKVLELWKDIAKADYPNVA